MKPCMVVVIALIGCGERVDWQVKYDSHAAEALRLESEVTALSGSMSLGKEGDAVVARIKELDAKIMEEIRLAREAKSNGAIAPDRQTEIVLLKSEIASANKLDAELDQIREATKKMQDSRTGQSTAEGRLNATIRRFDSTVAMADMALESLENQRELTRASRRLKILEALK